MPKNEGFKFADYNMLQDSPRTGTGDLLISVQAISPIKIPLPERDTENVIISLVQTITQNSSLSTEKALNDIIYQLYKLNEEEIDFIESK